MADPDMAWAPTIQSKKTLRIRNNAEVGLWSGVVAKAVDIFNDKAMKILRYEPVTDGGAHVVVKVAGSSSGDPKFGTTSVHGKTFKSREVAKGPKGNGVVEAEIFLPAEPSNKHANVLLHILLHEMTHAAGLEEHANEGIFITVPNIDQNGNITAVKGGKKMPSFFFSNKTLIRLRKIW